MSWKYYCCRKAKIFIELGIFIILGIVQELQCRKVTIVPVRDDISAPLLTCWTCSHGKNSPNEDCIKLSNKENITRTQCNLYEPFCKIQRLEADGKVEQIERSCTTDCNPGCHRYQTVKRCDSCCTQPFCNDGNNAERLPKQQPLILIIFLTLVVTASNLFCLRQSSILCC